MFKVMRISKCGHPAVDETSDIGTSPPPRKGSRKSVRTREWDDAMKCPSVHGMDAVNMTSQQL